MASGKANPKYEALLRDSDTLADTLDANDAAKTRLLRKMRANKWIAVKADLSTDELVALVLQKVESEGEQVFDEFIEFMSDIVGLENLAKKMKDASEPPKPSTSTTSPTTECDGDRLDIYELKNEVLPVASRWKGFGLALGLRSDVLDRIEGDYRKVDDCLQALLQEWVAKTETLRGPPSWQLVVDAVASPAGGNNQALAQDIARRHNATTSRRK